MKILLQPTSLLIGSFLIVDKWARCSYFTYFIGMCVNIVIKVENETKGMTWEKKAVEGKSCEDLLRSSDLRWFLWRENFQTDQNDKREPGLGQWGEICSRKNRPYIWRKGRICYIRRTKKKLMLTGGLHQ